MPALVKKSARKSDRFGFVPEPMLSSTKSLAHRKYAIFLFYIYINENNMWGVYVWRFVPRRVSRSVEVSSRTKRTSEHWADDAVKSEKYENIEQVCFPAFPRLSFSLSRRPHNDFATKLFGTYIPIYVRSS